MRPYAPTTRITASRPRGFFPRELEEYGLQRARVEAFARVEQNEALAIEFLGSEGVNLGANFGERLMVRENPKRNPGLWWFEWAAPEHEIRYQIRVVERKPPTFQPLPGHDLGPPLRTWTGEPLPHAPEERGLTVWKAGEEVPWWSVGLRYWDNPRHYPGKHGLSSSDNGHTRTPAHALFQVGDELYDYSCRLPRRGGLAPQRIKEVTRDWNGLGPRTIRILLPRGYDSAKREYPICYWHDGQNMFAHSRPENHWVPPWNLASTVERLAKAGEISEAIHVAVDNTPNRLMEYLPPVATFDQEKDEFNRGGRPGEADAYLELLQKHIHPYMLRHYRVMDDPDHTAMAGSSLGGLVSMYSGWALPEFARRLGVFSGSFWVADRFVKQIEGAGSAGRKPLLVYLDSGTIGPTSDNLDGTLRVRDALMRTGWLPGFDLRHVVGIGHRHNETAWRERLADCLRFLFPAGDSFHRETAHARAERLRNTVWHAPADFHPRHTGPDGPVFMGRHRSGESTQTPVRPKEMQSGGHAF